MQNTTNVPFPECSSFVVRYPGWGLIAIVERGLPSDKRPVAEMPLHAWPRFAAT